MVTSFSEKRTSERLTVREEVKIMLPNNGMGLDCIATNVSDGGARLLVRTPDLPEIFVLHFVASGKRRHCRVVWRQGAETGVAFTDRIQVNFGRRIASP
jgi:hypothetical protein